MTQYSHLLEKARCNVDFGNGAPPVEYLAHPSVFGALNVLKKAQPDWHSIRQVSGRRFDADFEGLAEHFAGQDDPAVIVRAADAALTVAASLRAARFAAVRVPKLEDTFMARAWGDGSLMSLMVEAVAITAKRGAPFSDGQCSAVWRFLIDCFRYPSIPPQAEASLYGTGFTVAEILATMACAHITDVADAYTKAKGAGATDMHRAAQEAREVAHEARNVIEQGVAHTLAR